ncbi:MAG TPA: effector binding domain-containing protein [Candidatus Avidehalobacter gallistercoris]|uniref:Effector binding domain-containing protein n=1 Tax=Candidatus Avidehalobacter gallistercoris TaxID=2840694 RepID=A0A9D1HKG6_9FIRM|nr:effector binding domain-containing protein [Candidatus Avidehalobacter gallistercoris]
MDKEFAFVSSEDYRKLSDPDPTEVGAWIQPDAATGELFYFFRPVAKDLSFIPQGLTTLYVEAANYAVFPIPPSNGNMTLLNENVRRMWKYVFGEWLPQNGNLQAAEDKIDLELYHNGKTFLYVPVVLK